MGIKQASFRAFIMNDSTNGFTRLGIGIAAVFIVGLVFILAVCFIDSTPVPWFPSVCLILMALLSYFTGKIIDDAFR